MAAIACLAHIEPMLTMAHDDLAAGRLVRLFPDIHFASPLAYFVVYRAESMGLAKLTAFRNWLHSEVG